MREGKLNSVTFSSSSCKFLFYLFVNVFKVFVLCFHCLSVLFSQDIAVMTNNVQQCEFYKTESQNVKSRWACIIPIATMEKPSTSILPNNKEDCEVNH